MALIVSEEVLNSYDIGRVSQIEPISIGLIHQTYKIIAEKGIFILQRLHPILSSDEIAEDFYAVTSHLAQQQFPAPQCVLTVDGKILATGEKLKWRMQTFIEGETYNKMPSADMAAEAGGFLAQLHGVLNLMDYKFKSNKIFHDTERIYKAYCKTLSNHEGSEFFETVEDEAYFIYDEISEILLPDSLPRRVTHGDPKISNFLFGADGKVAAVVDLDTCNRQTTLTELGDAFRSWCGKNEDDDKNTFDVSMFEKAWNGYKSGANGLLDEEECSLVPQAICTITLELAMRFLDDYFNDCYFGWDETRYESRCEHNLARARGQIALYNDLKAKLPQLQEIVK